MSIEKKSLISTLKTTKRANVASSTPSGEVSHKAVKSLPKTMVAKVVKARAKTMQKSAAKVSVKAFAKVTRA